MYCYDFDKTIFYPDSSCTFVLYCLRRFPGVLLKTLPKTALYALLRLFKVITVKRLKEQIFSFLPRIPVDVDDVVQDFWDKYSENIRPWYFRQSNPDDLVISASPEFLLTPIIREMGIDLIATRMDKHTGKIRGENCHGAEKLRRFKEEFPDSQIEVFYSDSLTDTPLAEFAGEAYLVKKDKISLWPDLEKPALPG